MTRDTQPNNRTSRRAAGARRRHTARRDSTPRERLVCLVLCLALALQPFLFPAAGAAPPLGSGKRADTPAAGRPSTPTKPARRQGAWRDGELLARFSAGATEQEVTALVESLGVRRSGKLRGQSGFERLALAPGQSPEDAASALRSSPAVEFAELNYTITADQARTPGDPLFPEQWALQNTGQAGGPAGADVGATAAWSQTTGSSRTVIAVIDTGVDFTHPDLAGNRWANPGERRNGRDDDGDGYADDLSGWDWVGESGRGAADASGHGTAVAGVIAAQGDNGVGVSGVMWSAGLMSLRVLDSTGRGTVADAVEAVDYAASHGAQVINCSWGLDDPSLALRDALLRAGAKGVLVVTSAGNAGRNLDLLPRYPASYGLPSVLAVASTNTSDQPSPWSNWGAGVVAVAAPGENLLTTKLGGGYAPFSGTSAAAALAAGVAGLVRTLRPDLSAERTRGVLVGGVRRVAGVYGRVSSGGVLDAAGAVGVTRSLGKEGGEEGDGEDVEGDGKKTSGSDALSDAGATPTPAPLPTPPAPSVGAPGVGLPNLDEARNYVPAPPRAIDPVPSTRRRCRPDNPNCNAEPGASPTPLPTPSPVPTPEPLPTPPWTWPSPSPTPTPSPTPAPSPSPVPLPTPGLALSFGATRGLLASFSDTALPWPGASSLAERPLVSQAAFDFYSRGDFSVSDVVFAVTPLGLVSRVMPALLIDIPTNLAVTSTSDTQVALSWSPAAEAVTYKVERSSSVSGTYTVVGETASTSFTDTGVTPRTTQAAYAYIYRVRAVDIGGNQSPASNTAMGTAITFLDDPLVAGVTKAKAQHVTELRVAVNAARHAAALADASWADATLTAATVKASHVQELRERLNEALAGLGVATLAFTDAPLATGANGTKVRKVHVEELRQRSTRGVITTAPAGSGTGLTARYYDNLGFTGFKLTRTDATVDFDWALGSPHPSVGADTFVVQWSGQVVPRYSETYTFYTQTDDGVELWVNNQKLVTNWASHALTEDSGQITLQAGQAYDIRMEYYDAYGGAVAKLLWSSQSQSKQIVPQSQLYGCWKTTDQFVKDFYQGALGRQPTSTELQGWTSRLAQAQGGAALAGEARALGRALFVSSEYDNRGRTNQQYVGDLYRAYLQRDPAQDTAGYNFWLGVVNGGPNGRENALRGFEQDGEFTGKLGKMCGIDPAASVYNFSEARLDPVNRTGGGGVDPYSRNYNWTLPLVGLPGRAGLDLGLSLSYNSLVWTKDGSGQAVVYDADHGFPGPGFRLGFPVIQPRFMNSLANKNAYLLITPSGARVELRETQTAGVYESVDSSYLQLTEEGGGLILRATDGTRMTFALLGGDYQCLEVKDRNGNYLTASYDGYGQIAYVTDTLGRVVRFQYDGYQNLIRITQERKREAPGGTVVDESGNTPHVLATFGYSNKDFATNFSDPLINSGSMTVIGPRNGEAVPVLTQVGLDDGSYYKFAYNTWGQVTKVTHYAADSAVNGVPQDTHALSYTSYNLPADASVAQADAPRFTEQTRWAEYGAGDTQQSSPVVTGYSPWVADAPSCDITLPDPTPGPGTSDNVVIKEFYATSTSPEKWMKGFTTRTEVWAGPEIKKWTTTAWAHDGGATDPATNPRVTAASVSDSGSTRRTEVEYLTAVESHFRLPKKVSEYQGAGTLLRYTETIYEPSSIQSGGAYASLRIIGLVKERRLYDAEDTLASRVGYIYDDQTPGEDFLQSLPSPATMHDAGYSTAFTTRGNVNRVRRYDVNSPSSYIESRVGYNVTGSAVFTKDAAGHKTSISYADRFWNPTNPQSTDDRNTFAYPTAVTVHETVPATLNVTATTDYNYDLGVATKIQVPKGGEAGYVAGPESKTYYDAAGRVQKVVNLATGTYTERVYPESMTLVQSFTTVKDESVTTPAYRAYSATALTGDGRVRGTASDHPKPGETGKYTGTRVIYDVLGRAEYASHPTEMTTSGGAWTPAGDDYNGGQWRWTRQLYDWKGRPSVTTNVDGTTKEAIYGGCGCAGGEVVTTRDEVGRRGKVTFDVLGRVWKSQVLSIQDKAQPFSPGTDADVYSTVTNTYNVRDQLKAVVEQAGVSGTSQLTTLEYDGHGRLWKRHAPEQDAGRFSIYTYFPDDTVETFTDARGAKTNYLYNDRHLTTSITYDISGVISGQNVAAAPGVTFQYYADGTRKLMDDGPGSIEYTYDQLGRLEAEKRRFDALGPNPFQITYGYTLAGALKSVKDPWDAQIDYGMDNVGRLTSVTGTPFGGVTQYIAGTPSAPGVLYRAWGGVKHVDYGNTRALDITYNPQLQPETFVIPGLMSKRYEYHADGLLRYTQDNLNSRFDRSYSYDQAGRISAGYSGPAARGETDTSDRPYRQTYQYDVWGNLTSRTTSHWSGSGGINYPEPQTYVNNRGVALGYDGTPAWKYDADGDITDSSFVQYTYDAAGDAVRSVSSSNDLTQVYDGEGRRAKAVEVNTYFDEYENAQTETATTYLVHSSVLGDALLAEVGEAGQKRRTLVYAGGAVVAWQVRPAQGADYVRWEHRDTSNASFRTTTSAGATDEAAEFDPLGSDAGLSNPYPLFGRPSFMASKYGSFGSTFNAGKSQCNVDFMERPCAEAMWMVGNGAAGVCPNNYCGATFNPNRDKNGRGGWQMPYFTDGGFINVSLGLSRKPPTLTFDDRTPDQKRRDRERRGKGRAGEDKGNNEDDKIFSKTKLSQEDCDKHIASLFGEEGSVVATAVEPRYVRGWQKSKYLTRKGHKIGTAHIYGDKYALSRATRLYTLAGGTLDRTIRGEYPEKDEDGTILGWSNHFQFNYKGGLSIRFFHVGGTIGGHEQGATLQPNPSYINAKGSGMIGYIGGIGGEGDPYPHGGWGAYNHTHIQFYLKGRLTDPRVIFCGW